MITQPPLAIAILAAGKGTRMRSSLPKVLHPLGGRSLLEWVLHSLRGLAIDRKFVIVGYGADQVKQAAASDPSLEFVLQAEQLGTGHAVQQLLPHLQGFEGDLLVLNGDVPLLRAETLQHLVERHRGNAATLLTARLANPGGYGRVFCDAKDQLTQIIEDRDCSPEQKQNNRVNAGVYCFHWPALEQALPKLSTNNDQQEYYLTEVVDYLSPAIAVDVADAGEILGINNRKQLAGAYGVLQRRCKDALMEAGVTLVDPDSITIDDTVEIGPEVIIEPQTHLRGQTKIGAGCRIGPGSLIENSTLGEGVTALYSVILDSRVGDHCRIGPYTHLRGQAVVGDRCRLGNFVEIKKSSLGNGTNVSHLSYIGDAALGEQVNIGAGTITANYDGVNKHKTVIGDRSKTGSNSVLVAPITIGSDVTIGAGSTLTQDVPSQSLAVARSRQVVKPGWHAKTGPSPSAGLGTESSESAANNPEVKL